MTWEDVKFIVAILGLCLVFGGVYGFVSTLITEFATRHKEGRQ